MKEVVAVAAARTPIGDFGGSLRDVQASDLMVTAIQAVLERAGLEKNDWSVIDDVLVGNCFMRTDEINIARTSMLKAGMPFTTPAATIQRQCASGMQATVFGYQKIISGECDVVLTGGVESMSNIPYVLYDMRWGARYRSAQATDMLYEGLTDPLDHTQMGVTAENLAEKYDISRQAQDELALTSQQRAVAAVQNGWFKEEIVPVSIPQRRGDPKIVDTDEHPRDGLTLEKLGKMKPVFKKDGSVTAANASGLNDGAAAMLIMTADKAKELGMTPLFRFRGHAVAAVEPHLMGYGPVPATEKLMKRFGFSLSDFELIELNEAFAAQYLACEHLLGLDRDITNPVGSGIALGHPVGATGARIMVTLYHQMKRLDKTLGLASLCVGGGMGKSVVIERLS